MSGVEGLGYGTPAIQGPNGQSNLCAGRNLASDTASVRTSSSGPTPTFSQESRPRSMRETSALCDPSGLRKLLLAQPSSKAGAAGLFPDARHLPSPIP